MVTQFNGKPSAKPPAASPTGKPAKPQAKKIETPASKAKKAGGTAFAGSN